MKRFIVFLIVMALFSSVFAADKYNSTVNSRVEESTVLYFGSDTLSTDNLYTQAMRVSQLTYNNMYVAAACSNVAGTEDVNVLVEYSWDRTNWVATALNSGAIDDMDNVTTTFKADTINVIGGLYCKMWASALWMRLKFDGQTSSPNTTLYWYVKATKTPQYVEEDKKSDIARALDKY